MSDEFQSQDEETIYYLREEIERLQSSENKEITRLTRENDALRQRNELDFKEIERLEGELRRDFPASTREIENLQAKLAERTFTPAEIDVLLEASESGFTRVDLIPAMRSARAKLEKQRDEQTDPEVRKLMGEIEYKRKMRALLAKLQP